MDTTLGRQIEDWRVDMGLTRPALGQEMGVIADLVYGWERRGVKPSPINMRKLQKMGFVASPQRDAA